MAKNPAKTSFSRAGIGLGVLVQSLCVVFLVVAANYVSFHYFERWDFSRSQRFTLAEQTKQVLRQADKKTPARIVVSFSPTSLDLAAALYGDLQNLLAEFEFSARDRLVVDWVDPTRDPARARELQSRYNFDPAQNVIVVEYAGRTKVVPIADLGDFDLSGLAMGEPPRLEAFRGEAVLTSALIELQNPDRARMYFLQGHGETSPAALTRFSAALSRQNVECLALNLAAAGGIPSDADAVCLIGARYDLPAAEIDFLRRYWQANGRLAILLEPSADTPNLRKFLNELCVYPRNDRVLRVIPSPVQPGVVFIERRVVGLFQPDSPITKRLVGVNAIFVGDSSSLYLDLPATASADLQVRSLIQAAEEYWGEARYTETEKQGVRYDDGEDTGTPIVLAASVEKGGARDDRTDVATSRLVVVSNCAFIEDAVVAEAAAQGNLDFMLSAMNRLLDRSKLTGVAPRAVTNYVLSLTEAQMRSIAFYTLVIIPAAAALLGLVVAFRRRA